MICAVCVERTTPNRTVVCNFCNFSCCQNCVKTYLTSTADDPNCMSCKRMWDREQMLKCLPKSFVNGEYKHHRENMLLEREKAMMPATQAHVDQELNRRKNTKLLQTLNEERLSLKRNLEELNKSIYYVQRNINPPLQSDKRAFIHKCSNTNCKGFLSTAWKCNVCSRYTCSECNVLKEDNVHHICKEEDKLTMQLLKKDSKKCPGCAQYIHKIDGCDQMWCVGCHTAFSWRTGNVINSTIHNPHFYEFQRSTGSIGRQIGDIPCGGLPCYRDVIRALQSLRQNHFDKFEKLLLIHRLVVHMNQEELPRFQHRVVESTNVDLRVKYMLNELSESEFKSKLQQREKALQKKHEISLILNMFIVTMSEMFREVRSVQVVGGVGVLARLRDMIVLMNYTNESIKNISVRYNCSVPCILNNYTVTGLMHSSLNWPQIID